MADYLHKTYGIPYSDIQSRLKEKQRERGIQRPSSRQVDELLRMVEEDLRHQARERAALRLETDATARPLPALDQQQIIARQRENDMSFFLSGDGSSSLNHTRDRMPPLLERQQVPLPTWQRIFDMVAVELVPAMQRELTEHGKYQNHRLNLNAGATMAAVAQNFERRLTLLSKADSASRSAILVQQKVGAFVNFLLVPHHVLATVKTKTVGEAVTIAGFEFTAMAPAPAACVTAPSTAMASVVVLD